MMDRDVLIVRVHDRNETLWAVTAEGQQPLTLVLFADALDMALTWAGESGGAIYRRDEPNVEPRLFNGAW